MAPYNRGKKELMCVYGRHSGWAVLDTEHVLADWPHRNKLCKFSFLQSIPLMFSSPGMSLSEVVHHGQQALLQASQYPRVYLCSHWAKQEMHHWLQGPGARKHIQNPEKIKSHCVFIRVILHHAHVMATFLGIVYIAVSSNVLYIYRQWEGDLGF